MVRQKPCPISVWKPESCRESKTGLLAACSHVERATGDQRAWTGCPRPKLEAGFLCFELQGTSATVCSSRAAEVISKGVGRARGSEDRRCGRSLGIRSIFRRIVREALRVSFHVLASTSWLAGVSINRRHRTSLNLLVGTR